MKHKNFNVIAQCLDELLRKHGFTRIKKNWYHREEDTILIVNLQKSAFGNQFRVGLGVLIRSLSDNPAPKINECHIMEQVERLALQAGQSSSQASAQLENQQEIRKCVRQFSDSAKQVVPFELSPQGAEEILKTRPAILKALDLEDQTMTDSERASIITDVMVATGLPFLHKCDSVAKIKHCLQTDQLRGAGVLKVVYGLCKLPVP